MNRNKITLLTGATGQGDATSITCSRIKDAHLRKLRERGFEYHAIGRRMRKF